MTAPAYEHNGAHVTRERVAAQHLGIGRHPEIAVQDSAGRYLPLGALGGRVERGRA